MSYKNSQYQKEYRLNHKEQNKDYQKEWYQKNKEKIKQRSKEYYQKNIEECQKCRKKYYQKNKEKLQKRHKEWRQENRDYMKEYNKKYRHENKEQWLQIIKEQNGKIVCSICDYDKCFGSIDFHHKDPKEKEYNIGDLLSKTPTPKRIEILKKELKKCIILCRNCHGEAHYL